MYSSLFSNSNLALNKGSHTEVAAQHGEKKKKKKKNITIPTVHTTTISSYRL